MVRAKARKKKERTTAVVCILYRREANTHTYSRISYRLIDHPFIYPLDIPQKENKHRLYSLILRVSIVNLINVISITNIS